MKGIRRLISVSCSLYALLISYYLLFGPGSGTYGSIDVKLCDFDSQAPGIFYYTQNFDNSLNEVKVVSLAK